ncbi:unnamed protein product, partial [Rotaria magnacalcarata]
MNSTAPPISTTPSTISTPSASSTATAFTTSLPITTALLCPLKEGMTNPQYLDSPQITGAQLGTSPSSLNPGSPGVNFKEPAGMVLIPIAAGISPILTKISIPNQQTNVIQITVTVITSTGDTPVNLVSSQPINTVDSFPITPIPAGSLIMITFVTAGNQPPENVTLSVIGCYEPSTATTIVTTEVTQ